MSIVGVVGTAMHLTKGPDPPMHARRTYLEEMVGCALLRSACIHSFGRNSACVVMLCALARCIYAVERLKGGSRGLPPVFVQNDGHRYSLTPRRPFYAGQVVQDMWHENPERRPSARQVVARLERIQEELGVW